VPADERQMTNYNCKRKLALPCSQGLVRQRTEVTGPRRSPGPFNPELCCGDQNGVDSLRRAAVLMDNRPQNEGKGDQPRQIDKRLLLAGHVSQSERDAR
jgi:hypothetical protein